MARITSYAVSSQECENGGKFHLTKSDVNFQNAHKRILLYSFYQKPLSEYCYLKKCLILLHSAINKTLKRVLIYLVNFMQLLKTFLDISSTVFPNFCDYFRFSLLFVLFLISIGFYLPVLAAKFSASLLVCCTDSPTFLACSSAIFWALSAFSLANFSASSFFLLKRPTVLSPKLLREAVSKEEIIEN